MQVVGLTRRRVVGVISDSSALIVTSVGLVGWGVREDGGELEDAHSVVGASSSRRWARVVAVLFDVNTSE